MDEIKTNVAEDATATATDTEPVKQTRTAEEQIAELLAETKRLKKAVDKSSADASSWKKKYMETQSESEKLSMEKAERDAALKEELESLRRESKVNKYAKSFMSIGYSEEMATKAAEAQFDGDTDELFRIQKIYASETEKRIRADIMKSMPVPSTSNDDSIQLTQEQFDEMTYREQLDLFEKHPSVYEKFTKH